MKRPRQLRPWLESLMKRSSSGYLLVTREAKIRYANPAALVLFDAEQDTMGGTPVDRWIPGVEISDEPRAETEAEGASRHDERFPLEYSMTPVDDDSGHVWIVVRDIQNRKGMEGSVRNYADELEKVLRSRARELDEARERHGKFAEIAPVLDLELDSQGGIASANRKASLTLGVPADRLVGVPILDLALPEARERFRADFEKLGGGSSSPIETRLRGVQGAGIDVVFHPCRTEIGGRQHLRLIGLDVSARREAERLVEQSLDLAETQRARMERFLRGIGEPVVVTDPDGQVRLMNDIAAVSLGIDEPLAFGRDLFSEQLDTRFVGTWREFLSGDEDVATAELRWGEGGTRTFLVSMSRVRMNDGRCAGCVCILRNVTEERNTDRRKQDFMANVTYELRTSFTSIRSLVTALSKDGSIAAEEDRRMLGMIDREAARVQIRIGDLLTLMRLESGQETADTQPANISRLLREAATRFAGAATLRGVTLEVKAEIEGDGIFDPDKIRRVVDRLLTNALRFTPRNGRITASVGRNDGRFDCIVEDSGKGMEGHALRRALDPLASVDAPGISGTPGLGLHVIRRFVELHGGDITAASRPGRGTTFRFWIPVVPPEAARDEERKEDPPADGPLTDDPDPIESEL